MLFSDRSCRPRVLGLNRGVCWDGTWVQWEHSGSMRSYGNKSCIFLEWRRNITTIYVGIQNIPAEVWAQHIPNTNLEHYAEPARSAEGESRDGEEKAQEEQKEKRELGKNKWGRAERLWLCPVPRFQLTSCACVSSLLFSHRENGTIMQHNTCFIFSIIFVPNTSATIIFFRLTQNVRPRYA